MNTPLQTNTVYLDSLNCVKRSPDFLYNLATPIRCPVSLKILLSVENVTFRNTLPNVVDGKMSFIYDTLGMIVESCTTMLHDQTNVQAYFSMIIGICKDNLAMTMEIYKPTFSWP